MAPTNSTKEKSFFPAALAMTSGLLLGLSFPPSPFYSFAFVAFIPFFYLYERMDSYIQAMKYSYLLLFIFHLLTVYWTGGFAVGKDVWMMTAGAAVILIHPLFFMPFILLAFLVKKKFGIFYGLIAFVLFWTSFEFLHSLGEYSFPWLTIGNSQAYDVNRIQMIEYTSIYGLTVHILSFNALSFWLLRKLGLGVWKLRTVQTAYWILLLLIVYYGPILFGTYLRKHELFEGDRTIAIGFVQPNFDPWEKWGGEYGEKWESYIHQLQTYNSESKLLGQERPDLILWPETAIPFHILMPRYSAYLSDLFSLVDTLNIPIFTGLPVAEYFDSVNAPATAQRIGRSNSYVETYNSTILIQPKRILGPIHKKTILVPFAERIPYAETFRFLIEPLKWNVGISSWGKGSDTTINTLPLTHGKSTKFSGMICYESVYPNYVREFVKRGAEFLVIITNDSWWGNTSGAYQHASFAALRAVETRRWVVQCANGGISLVADPTGKIYSATNLFSKACFKHTIGLRSESTFYVRYGDVVGIASLIGSALVLIALFTIKPSEKEE